MSSLFLMEHSVKDGRLNFQKEIFNIMHACGDNPNPNPATVILVESIVYEQLRAILFDANERAQTRKNKNITHGDIIFLYRGNITRLRRMHKYFSHYHLLKTKNLEMDPQNINGASLGNGDGKSESLITQAIRSFDEFGEIDQPFEDVIDSMRKHRAAKLADSYALEKYQAYHAARCTSFRSGLNDFTKLSKWLDPNDEFKKTNNTMAIFAYLAFEMVAEIVDLSFLVRQDSKKRADDPFAQFYTGIFCNPSSLNNAVCIKSGFEGVPPITVAEVREALRRHQNNSIGIDGLFYRNLRTNVTLKFIAIS